MKKKKFAKHLIESFSLRIDLIESFSSFSFFCYWFSSIENMNITLKTMTHLYEKDGHVFYNITGTQVDYTLSGLKLRLDNLFDGVKVLGKYAKLRNWIISSIDLILAQRYRENFFYWLFVYFIFPTWNVFDVFQQRTVRISI